MNAIIGWVEILSKPEMQDMHDEAIEWIGKWANGVNAVLGEAQVYIDHQKHN
jgi:hypothetical protein